MVVRRRRGRGRAGARGNQAHPFGRALPGRGLAAFAGGTSAEVVSSGISCNTASPLAQAPCDVPPAPCGVDVLGATTLVTDPTGVAIGAQAILTVTAGDACQFQPVAAYVTAYQFQAATTIANATRLPLMLIRLDIGQVSALRRAGGNGTGIITDPFNAQQATVMAIRTGPFSSTNEQNMTWTLQNLNNQIVHIFLDIWGYAIN